MPREHFRYALLTWFKETFKENNLGGVIDERIKKLSQDPTVQLINQLYKSNDPSIEKIKINPKLREAIFKDKIKSHSPLENAIYIYIKMCKLLTYDEEFMASNQTGPLATIHEDISHIYEITPEDNKVVCYEFSAIYSSLLKEIGIPSEIVKASNDYTKYGGEHTKVRFKDLGRIITVDSATSILFSDIFAAKINLPLIGINIEKGNERKRFSEIPSIVKSIYKHIAEEENDLNLNVKNLDTLLNEYENETDNILSVSFKEKLDILIRMINSTKLKGVDAYSYLLYLKNNVLIHDSNIKISIIRDDTKDIRTLRAIIVIRGFDENDEEYIYYYSFMPGQPLTPISLGQLQLMFNTNKLGYINEKNSNRIEGILVK